jgi:hypothetical protein
MDTHSLSKLDPDPHSTKKLDLDHENLQKICAFLHDFQLKSASIVTFLLFYYRIALVSILKSILVINYIYFHFRFNYEIHVFIYFQTVLIQ